MCRKCPLKNQAPAACKVEQEWVDGHIGECPVQWIDQFATVFQAVNYKEKGVLPHSGGWAEQPAKLMQLMDVVLSERMT